MTIFFIIQLGVLAIVLGFLMRNERVYNYRGKIIDAVYELNKADIRAGKKNYARLDHRWEALESVSYHRMTLMFWKPLASFFDQDFLKEIGLK